MSDSTEFLFDEATFTIHPDGEVVVHWNARWQSANDITVSADEFKQLAQAQQNAVWAAQHWTSLAQVSDALASLLVVHQDVFVETIQRENTKPITYSAYLGFGAGLRRWVGNVSEVQELFTDLNAAK